MRSAAARRTPLTIVGDDEVTIADAAGRAHNLAVTLDAVQAGTYVLDAKLAAVVIALAERVRLDVERLTAA